MPDKGDGSRLSGGEGLARDYARASPGGAAVVAIVGAVSAATDLARAACPLGKGGGGKSEAPRQR